MQFVTHTAMSARWCIWERMTDNNPALLFTLNAAIQNLSGYCSSLLLSSMLQSHCRPVEAEAKVYNNPAEQEDAFYPYICRLDW